MTHPAVNASSQVSRHSTDLRARKSREAIVAALISLEDEGAEVSPRAIAERASINRSSFYRHFKDLNELAQYVLDAAFDEIGIADRAERTTKRGEDLTATRRVVARIVEHFASHRALYASVFGGALGAAAIRTAQLRFRDEMVRTLFAVPEYLDDIDPAVSLTYMSAGALAVLAEWVQGRVALDQAGITDQLVAMIPAWLLVSAPEPETAEHVRRRSR